MASSKLSIFKVKLQCDTSWDSIIGSVLQILRIYIVWLMSRVKIILEAII